MFTGSTGNLVWGAVFSTLLVIGCVTDIRSRKIPNELVVAILATGWLFALMAANPVRAMGMSLAGSAIGFAIWIGFHVLGAIGAGDVKFFAAAGAWLGPALTWRAALVAGLVGGILAVGMLVLEKRLGSALRHMAMAASSRSLSVVSPGAAGADTTKARRLPYGVALAVGTLVVAWFPGFIQR